MPVLNRTGMSLCVKKHPLWIRILLTPQLTGNVLLRDASSVVCDGVVYGVKACSFDPAARIGQDLRVERQAEATLHCVGVGTLELAPVEYLSSVLTGFSLTAISKSQGGESAQCKHRCEELRGSPHPALSLEFTDGTAVVRKCVYAKAFEHTEK